MIPNYSVMRDQLIALADQPAHPYKTGYHPSPVEEARRRAAVARGEISPDDQRPHKYGRLIYADRAKEHGGADVALMVDGCYLVAHGADHEDSVWALAHHLGLESSGPTGVVVEEVDAGWFWLHCNPTGRIS